MSNPTVDDILNVLLMIKSEHGGDVPVGALWDGAVTELNQYAMIEGALVFNVENHGEFDLNIHLVSYRHDFNYVKPPECIGCFKNSADSGSDYCPGCQAYSEHQR